MYSRKTCKWSSVGWLERKEERIGSLTRRLKGNVKGAREHKEECDRKGKPFVTCGSSSLASLFRVLIQGKLLVAEIANGREGGMFDGGVQKMDRIFMKDGGDGKLIHEDLFCLF